MPVVDNNVLSSLAKIDRLDLLPFLFDSLFTTPEVMHEFRDERVAGFGFVEAIQEVHTYGKATRDRWLVTTSPGEEELKQTEDLLELGLAPADAECLSIAKTRALLLATDDQHLGHVAMDHGVQVADLETLLLAAAHRGFFDRTREGRDLLVGLREEDYYVFSPNFEDAFLQALEGSVSPE